VVYWLVGALLLAFGSLAAARYITSPLWVDALAATGGFLGLALAMAVGIALRRLAREGWKPVAALALALGAALARASLVLQLAQDAEAQLTVSFTRLALACSSVVWGAIALVWGTLAISEALEGPRRSWPRLLTAALATSLALYSVAPLWGLLGLRINHWTLLGLFGLACLAYGAGRLWSWLRQKLRPS
jgi:hypothetical protein